MYIAKVDATEHTSLAERYEIKGFPTLYWFVDGERSEYTGGRTTDTIVSWITKKSGPPAEHVKCDDVKKVTESEKLSSVYFGEKAGEMYDTFLKAASKNDNMKFFEADKDCAAEHGAAAPGVSIFRSFDESPVHYSGSADSAELDNWTDMSSIPTIITFSEDYIEPIFGKGRQAIVFFSNEQGSELHKKFADAAKELKGDVLFVESGTQDGIQQRLAEFVGMDASQTPSIRLLNPGEEMRKYAYTEDIKEMTTESIKKFIDEVLSGKIRPHLKSEAIPANDGPLTTLVGDNWADIVMDENKDVLVKYYAPWCGHCKKLAPIWDELADSVKDMDDLVIAKFDATANEVEGLGVKGYPTLKWYPKGDKSGLDYDGGRELPDFTKFLSENSSAYKKSKDGHDEL